MHFVNNGMEMINIIKIINDRSYRFKSWYIVTGYIRIVQNSN